MIRDDLAAYDLPDAPGVYLFYGANKNILYIGKATSLRDRVRSYFSSDVSVTRSHAVAKMVRDAQTLAWHETDSVLEALILEANLIKRHQPPYNIQEKDNKSFNYLVITKELFPRVLVVRGRDLFQNWKETDIKKVFGPYPHGRSLNEALKIVRKIFPFRDTCAPKSGKPCFNRQIGLCPGVCTGDISARAYGVTVKHIAELFGGNMKGLRRSLVHEMKKASDEERFEDARSLQRQSSALEHIRDVSLISEDRLSAGGGIRLEAYDTAHTGGSETVAVMTVVSDGEPVRAAYRKFIIRTATNDDVASLKEVLSRRLAHTEWPLPRAFVIDGGTAQVRAAERILAGAGVSVPVIGVVKNHQHNPQRLMGDTTIIAAHEKDILRANAEAHRFAITFHRARRRAGML